MKNKFWKWIALGLTSVVLASCSSGNGNYFENKAYFHIESSDEGFDTFLNEYYLRHVREGDWAVDSLKLGYGSLYMKEWEARSLVWHDTSALSGDRLGKLKYYINDFPIDKFGYMWSTSYRLEQTQGMDVNNAFGQGWPIPNYTSLDECENAGWEFDYAADGWTTNGEAKISSGMYTSEATTDELWYLSPQMEVNAQHAPMIGLDIRVINTEDYDGVDVIDDIYIAWQTQSGGDTWFEISQKEWSTIPQEQIGSFFGRKMFYPMYLHEDWDGETITRVKISVRATDGQTLSLKGNLNYCRLDFDTRQSNNNAIFLCYANEYFRYNNDEELMGEQLSKFRKMISFMIKHLNGESGLLDISYLYGHDGLGLTVGHGLGNGYWDIYSAPEINIDANVYFYKALLAMAEIEERATAYGVNADKADAAVVNSTNDGMVAYEQTAESLRALAERVKNRISEYFWNEETGRFFYGYVQDRKIDYGYVQFNLEAITAGVATEAQKDSIMSWINGDRIVESDLGEDEQGRQTGSTGDDIYFFEFAPRSTTKKNWKDYSITWEHPDTRWGRQVQDGGAIMYVTYYDLISREDTFGVNDAHTRMKEIQTWYEKIKTADGNGENFYPYYYNGMGATYKLQGGGQVGAIGLAGEFLENAMVYNYVSDVLLNLQATTAYNLTIVPTLPDGLETLTAYNLIYDGITYDLTVTADYVQVKNVRGETAGRTLTIVSPSGETRTVAFGNCKL